MKRKEKKRKLKYEFPPYIAISHDHEQDRDIHKNLSKKVGKYSMRQ